MTDREYRELAHQRVHVARLRALVSLVRVESKAQELGVRRDFAPHIRRMRDALTKED